MVVVKLVSSPESTIGGKHFDVIIFGVFVGVSILLLVVTSELIFILSPIFHKILAPRRVRRPMPLAVVGVQ